MVTFFWGQKYVAENIVWFLDEMCEPVIYDEPVLEFLENNMAKKLEGFIKENKMGSSQPIKNESYSYLANHSRQLMI